MNRELKRYRRQVKQKLRCVGRTKRALLARLDQDLARYAAEEPSASYSDAVLAIGTPSEVAAELNETLTEKQSETLEKYDEAVNEMHSLAEVEAFSYGFRLGVRLMIEAVDSK